MKAALAYGPTPGLADLTAWARELQLAEHAPPRSAEEWQVHFTTGSQDAISKCADMLLNRGDSVLVEEPCYPGALAVLQPLGVKIAGIPTDAKGVIPDAMADLLKGWDHYHPGAPNPRVLYTIPTGHNPSGATISAERRAAVYALAQQHNLLIMEDDPYFFLQLDGPRDASGVCRAPP